MSFISPAKPWEAIERHYADAVERRHAGYAPMLAVVRRLRQPPFEESLFAVFSWWGELYVSQTRTIRQSDAVLKIAPGPNWDEVTFEYFDYPEHADPAQPLSWAKPWRTTAPAAEAVAKLEHVLCRRLRWYRRVDA